PSFFFSSRRRHTSFSRDWSSDVCSSDLQRPVMGIVEKADDLTRHRARRSATAIAGNHQNIRFVYLYTFAFVKRNAHGGQPDTLRSEERRVGKACGLPR